MARYLFLHCPYDPGSTYTGYRMLPVEATSMEEAEKAGWAWLEERDNLLLIRHDKFEYRVVEVADEVGPRVYSLDRHKRV